MKRVTVAALAFGRHEALETLRELGILHLQAVQTEDTPELSRALAERARLEDVLGILASVKPGRAETAGLLVPDLVEEVLELAARAGVLKDRLAFVEREIERIAPLGDFPPEEIDFLRRQGLIAKIYLCSRAELDGADIPVAFEIVSVKGRRVFLLAVSDRDFDLPLEAFPVPEKRLGALEEERTEIRMELDRIERRLADLAPNAKAIRSAIAFADERLTFARALASLREEGPIHLLRGYCPADECGRLREAGVRAGFGVMVEEPAENEEVPTLIQNPRWVRIIEPVFDFMGTVPGYREYDVSFWFLASLGLFFAMLVGDAGYGLLFLLGAVAFGPRLMRKVPAGLVALLCLFGAETVVWGAITGSWFGLEALSRLGPLRSFVVESLYGFSDNRDTVIRLCFLIGACHLTAAHGIRAARFIRSPRALGELGWVLIVWFLYFLAGNLVLGRPLPARAVYLLPMGMFLTSAFSTPGGRFFHSFALSLADLPLNVVRAFSDVVSYLRLFAVGYATLIVAASFNEMAGRLGWGSVAGAVGASLVLLVGHALNILLAAMAVLVHGVRLNMLEFSSHLGMAWSGMKFAPFRRSAPGADPAAEGNAPRMRPEARKEA